MWESAVFAGYMGVVWDTTWQMPGIMYKGLEVPMSRTMPFIEVESSRERGSLHQSSRLREPLLPLPQIQRSKHPSSKLQLRDGGLLQKHHPLPHKLLQTQTKNLFSRHDATYRCQQADCGAEKGHTYVLWRQGDGALCAGRTWCWEGHAVCESRTGLWVHAFECWRSAACGAGS